MPESQRPTSNCIPKNAPPSIPKNNSRLPHGRNSRRTAPPALPLPSPTYKKGRARKPAL